MNEMSPSHRSDAHNISDIRYECIYYIIVAFVFSWVKPLFFIVPAILFFFCSMRMSKNVLLYGLTVWLVCVCDCACC